MIRAARDVITVLMRVASFQDAILPSRSGKKHHLNTGGAGVVAVGDGVDDRLGDNFRRYFIRYRHLRAKGASTDGKVNLDNTKFTA